LSDFQDIVNPLSTLELVVGEELQALFLLSSLLDSWETLAVTISNSAPGSKLSLSIVKDCLFNKKARRKGMSADINQALVTEGRGRSKSRGSKGKGKGNNRSQSKGELHVGSLENQGI